MNVKAIIFDLDGVITDTAHLHFLAWKQLADSLNILFNEADNEQLKGLDRMLSLDKILSKGSVQLSFEEKEALAACKNQYYQTQIASMTPENLLPGAIELLYDLKRANLKIGLASSSKNAISVIQHLNIKPLFDYVADANHIKRSKPHPEIFLTVARQLGCNPKDCVGIEDSMAGIQAIKASAMFAIGIGAPQYLSQADMVFSSLDSLSAKKLQELHGLWASQLMERPQVEL